MTEIVKDKDKVKNATKEDISFLTSQNEKEEYFRHTFTPTDCKSKKNPKTTPENYTEEKGNIDTKNKKDSDEVCVTRDTENMMSVHLNKNHGINEKTKVQNDSDGKSGTQTLNFNNVYLVAKNALNMNYHVIIHGLTLLFQS